jgi:hypothetical protein
MVVEVFGGDHGYGEDFSVADPGKAVALMTNTCHGVGNDAIGSYNERVVHGLTSSADVSNTSLQDRPYGRQLAITVNCLLLPVCMTIMYLGPRRSPPPVCQQAWQ